jgi:hypothetical protein
MPEEKQLELPEIFGSMNITEKSDAVDSRRGNKPHKEGEHASQAEEVGKDSERRT